MLPWHRQHEPISLLTSASSRLRCLRCRQCVVNSYAPTTEASGKRCQLAATSVTVRASQGARSAPSSTGSASNIMQSLSRRSAARGCLSAPNAGMSGRATLHAARSPSIASSRTALAEMPCVACSQRRSGLQTQAGFARDASREGARATPPSTKTPPSTVTWTVAMVPSLSASTASEHRRCHRADRADASTSVLDARLARASIHHRLRRFTSPLAPLPRPCPARRGQHATPSGPSARCTLVTPCARLRHSPALAADGSTPVGVLPTANELTPAELPPHRALS